MLKFLPIALPLALLASCGGGGGDGGSAPPPTSAVSAGANRDAAASEPISLTATAMASAEVTGFVWSQTAGETVALSGAGSDVLSFTTPARSETLEFEVTGRRADGTVAGTDRVIVGVSALRPRLNAPLLAAIDIRGGGEGRATSAALHGATSRLFVVDSDAGDVVCYDVSNPSSPQFAGTVAPPAIGLGYNPGPALAVAAGDSGTVVITWSGQTLEFPGRAMFIDPVTLASLAEFSTTGANPTDVAITPDGRTVAIACAADPPNVGGGDGRGYVTLFHIPDGGPSAIQVHADIAPIVLASFDGNEDILEQRGVRFFAGSPTASVELTPRSVAISADGSRVWATCPENDALVVIDAASQLVLDVVGLEDRPYASIDGGAALDAERWTWTTAPSVLTSAAGDAVPFGGITGLAGVASLPGDRLALSVVTGAGPTVGAGAGATDRNGDGVSDVTLLDPNAQLALTRVVVARSGAEPEVDETTLLSGAGGAAITGRPSLFQGAAGEQLTDEQMVDLDGGTAATSTQGARFGGATTAPGGELWLADTRRAGVWRFSASGSLVARYNPVGTPSTLGQTTLPATYGRRRANLAFDTGRRFGGFGAIAYHPDRGTVFAATRLPLDNPDTASDATSATSRIARLIELDRSSGAVVGEFVLVLDAAGHALEGMAYSTGDGFERSLALLEAAIDPSGFRGVYRLDLDGATDLQTLSVADYAAVDAALESTAPGDLAELQVAIVPVRKALRADLTGAGLGGGGRPSALAFSGDDLVIAFDDDYGLASAAVTETNGRLTGADLSGSGSVAVVRLQPAGIDASASGSFQASALPIVGMPQPVDVAVLEAGGESRLAMANGGMARVIEHLSGGNTFDERERVGDLVLDTNVFPNAAILQSPGVAGDLLVSSVDADTDGNMFVDRLQAFGSRSLSVHDAAGGNVWQSSRSLVERASALRGAMLDSASTDRGIRPGSVAVRSIGGMPVIAVGLRGASLVALFDATNPAAPILSGFAAGESATGDLVDVDLGTLSGTTGLLIVTDRARGRVELRRLQRDG